MQIAKQVVAAAEQAAVANHNHMFILIVDDGGNLMYMERMDEAQLGSFNVALAKARSAVFFKRPTKMFEDAVIKNGYTPILKLPEAMPIEGGIPLLCRRPHFGRHWRERRYSAGRWESGASGRGCVSRYCARALVAKHKFCH